MSSLRRTIETYDKEIALTIKQIKFLQNQCKTLQKRRTEAYLLLKELEGKKEG